MSDCAHRFRAVALAAFGEIQSFPIRNQFVERECRLYTLALRFLLSAQPLGARIDALCDISETRSGRIFGLLDGDISPDAQRLPDLASRCGVGPLHDEGARFRRHAHAEAAAFTIEHQPVFPTGIELQSSEKAICELWHWPLPSSEPRTRHGPGERVRYGS